MSARHRQQKKQIREIKQLVEALETIIAAYEVVAEDLPESGVVAHAVLAMRKAELEVALGRTHRELSSAQHTLATMPKRKETV